MATIHDLLVKQIIGLSWIRCCMEEGVSFINKETGENETSEKVVFDAFEAQSGLFDMPKANVSPAGMEKNIKEVIGSYILYGTSSQINQLLLSLEVTQQIRDKIDVIRSKDKSLQKSA